MPVETSESAAVVIGRLVAIYATAMERRDYDEAALAERRVADAERRAIVAASWSRDD